MIKFSMNCHVLQTIPIYQLSVSTSCFFYEWRQNTELPSYTCNGKKKSHFSDILHVTIIVAKLYSYLVDASQKLYSTAKLTLQKCSAIFYDMKLLGDDK